MPGHTPWHTGMHEVCASCLYRETKEYTNSNVEEKLFKHILIHCTTEQELILKMAFIYGIFKKPLKYQVA